MPEPAANALRDRPESPDERMERRRARRWSRRLRMVGPFVGFALLVATLALSVDLIESEPPPETDRLASRPIPSAIRDRDGAMRGATATPGVSKTSVVGEGHASDLPTPALSLGIDDDPGAASGPDRPGRGATDGPFAFR